MKLRSEVDIEEAKRFGWIKKHALWSPTSQILLRRRRVSQSLRKESEA